MTSYERLLSAIAGKKPDRTPVAPEVFGVAGRLSGYRLSDYVQDGRIIAEAQARIRAEVGYDILFAFADLSVEAEALGCALEYPVDAYPSVQQHCFRDIRDAEGLKLPDPLRSGRMPVVVESCRLLREKAGAECVVASCIMGPISLASQLMGLEAFLYLLADSSTTTERLLDFTEQVATQYGTALIKAGAHCPVVFDPIASPAVMPPALFLHHEAPRLKRMFARFAAAGAPVSWISIAGATQKIMPAFSRLGINLATIDYEVSVAEGFRLGNGIALNGNLKPFSFVNSTPVQIKEAVWSCLKEAGKRNNFIIGSGCEVPVESSLENLKALVDGVKEFQSGGAA